MTEAESITGMRRDAEEIIEQHVHRLISEDSESELQWIPDDFGRQIASLAWAHQFDIDKGRFRRNLNRYLDAISRIESP